jgi:hypothetical protein
MPRYRGGSEETACLTRCPYHERVRWGREQSTHRRLHRRGPNCCPLGLPDGERAHRASPTARPRSWHSINFPGMHAGKPQEDVYTRGNAQRQKGFRFGQTDTRTLSLADLYRPRRACKRLPLTEFLSQGRRGPGKKKKSEKGLLAVSGRWWRGVSRARAFLTGSRERGEHL